MDEVQAGQPHATVVINGVQTRAMVRNIERIEGSAGDEDRNIPSGNGASLVALERKNKSRARGAEKDKWESSKYKTRMSRENGGARRA